MPLALAIRIFLYPEKYNPAKLDTAGSENSYKTLKTALREYRFQNFIKLDLLNISGKQIRTLFLRLAGE